MLCQQFDFLQFHFNLICTAGGPSSCFERWSNESAIAMKTKPPTVMWGIVQNKISYYILYVKNIVIYMYEHVNIHIHMHTCIHTYIHTCTHIHPFTSLYFCSLTAGLVSLVCCFVYRKQVCSCCKEIKTQWKGSVQNGEKEWR